MYFVLLLGLLIWVSDFLLWRFCLFVILNLLFFYKNFVYFIVKIFKNVKYKNENIKKKENILIVNILVKLFYLIFWYYCDICVIYGLLNKEFDYIVVFYYYRYIEGVWLSS